MNARPAARQRWAQLGVAAAFSISGALHFMAPGPYRRIVPRALARPAALVAWSGAAELACAAGLLAGAGWAGPASAALLLAVFPANMQLALDVTADPAAGTWRKVAAWLRLPLQVPLILGALGRIRPLPSPIRSGTQPSALEGSSSTARV